MKNSINPKMFGTLYGVNNEMMDTLNKVATEFVEENYDQLVKVAGYMGVDPEKVHDIVHDVYVSLRNSEDNGEGYDETCGNKDGCISVSEFVYGRMKKYAMNKKYKSNSFSSTEVSASSNGEDVRDMNAAQVVLSTAQAYDPIASLDEDMSICEEIEALVTFASNTSLNIRFILKNISSLANMDFDVSLLSDLRAFLKNEEHSELFTSVVTYAGINPVKYRDLVASL